MVPILEVAEDGQPKCGIWVRSLCKPPKPTFFFPALSFRTTQKGRTSSPHTTMSFTYSKTGGGRGMEIEGNFLDDFGEYFRLIFDVNF